MPHTPKVLPAVAFWLVEAIGDVDLHIRAAVLGVSSRLGLMWARRVLIFRLERGPHVADRFPVPDWSTMKVAKAKTFSHV